MLQQSYTNAVTLDWIIGTLMPTCSLYTHMHNSITPIQISKLYKSFYTPTHMHTLECCIKGITGCASIISVDTTAWNLTWAKYDVSLQKQLLTLSKMEASQGYASWKTELLCAAVRKTLADVEEGRYVMNHNRAALFYTAFQWKKALSVMMRSCLVKWDLLNMCTHAQRYHARFYTPVL